MPLEADPEWLGTFDDMVVELLKAFGITNTAIIGLVILAFSVKSWMDGIASSFGIASKGIQSVTDTTRSLRLRGTTIASLVTALVAIAVAAALSMAYVAGNFLSLAIQILSKDDVAAGEAKMAVFERAWTDSGVSGLFQLVSSPSLSLDVPAAVVLLIAVFGFYRAFRNGVHSSWFGWGFVASFPVSLWFLPVFPLAVLAYLINLAGPGIDMSDPNTRAGVFGVMLTGLYCVGMTVAVRGAQIAGSAWRAPSTVS